MCCSYHPSKPDRIRIDGLRAPLSAISARPIKCEKAGSPPKGSPHPSAQGYRRNITNRAPLPTALGSKLTTKSKAC